VLTQKADADLRIVRTHPWKGALRDEDSSLQVDESVEEAHELTSEVNPPMQEAMQRRRSISSERTHFDRRSKLEARRLRSGDGNGEGNLREKDKDKGPSTPRQDCSSAR
jgi:hypothetical protein